MTPAEIYGPGKEIFLGEDVLFTAIRGGLDTPIVGTKRGFSIRLPEDELESRELRSRYERGELLQLDGGVIAKSISY